MHQAFSASRPHTMTARLLNLRMRLTRILLLLNVCLAVAVVGSDLTSSPLKPDLVVAADGTGDFKSIHDAVQSIPRTNRERRIIFVKTGVYTEQIRVDAA